MHDVAHILNSHQQMKVISLPLLPTKVESDSQVLIRPPCCLRNCDLKWEHRIGLTKHFTGLVTQVLWNVLCNECSWWKITSICPSESNSVCVVPWKSNRSGRSVALFKFLTLSSLLLSSSGHLIIITFASQRYVLQIYLKSTSCLEFAQPLRSYGCDDQLLSSDWVEDQALAEGSDDQSSKCCWSFRRLLL